MEPGAEQAICRRTGPALRRNRPTRRSAAGSPRFRRVSAPKARSSSLILSDERALHVDRVEPLSELEADRLHAPRLPETASLVKRDRCRLAAADHRDHLPESGLARRLDQRFEK